MNDLELQALLCSINAHKYQFRNNEKPYVFHPIRVAELVRKDTLESYIIAAAYLHDVLEDTIYSIRDFSISVVDIVELLTKEKGMSKIDAIYKLSVSNEAILIKMADRLDNFSEISKFRNEYIKKSSVIESTKLLLDVAKQNGLNNTNVYISLKSLCNDIGVFNVNQ